MIEFLSRRLHVSVETFEQRMLQAHDHVVQELQFLGYAVQNLSDQQKQQYYSLRRIQQRTALICQHGDPIDGLVSVDRNSVPERVADQACVHQRLQHNVENTTTLSNEPGRKGFLEPPIEWGSLISREDQHLNQVQLPGSIERKLSQRNSERLSNPATKPSSRQFHAARLSPKHTEPSEPDLPSGHPQNSMTSLQVTTSHCGSDCCCSCHRMNRYRSPSLLKTLIGSLSVGYHTSPWAAPTCNSPSCGHHSKKFTYIYAFPQWLRNRIRLAHLAYSQSRGPEFCLRVLRVRSYDSDIMRSFRGFASSDEEIILEVTRLFVNGEASVLDVDENGTSVLGVRLPYNDASVTQCES